MTEAEEKQRQLVHVRLPDEVARKLKIKCAYDGVTQQQFLEAVIREALANYDVPTPPTEETSRE